MIAVDLGKQKAIDADRMVIQQVKFTTNLNRAGNTRIKRSKRNCLRLFIRNFKSFGNTILLRDLIFISIK